MKQKQADLNIRMKDYSKDDENFVINVSYVMELANQASDLFNADSSKPELKRRLINCVLSNLKLEGKKLVYDLKEPFKLISQYSNNDSWLPGSDSNRQPRS